MLVKNQRKSAMHSETHRSGNPSIRCLLGSMKRGVVTNVGLTAQHVTLYCSVQNWAKILARGLFSAFLTYSAFEHSRRKTSAQFSIDF